MPPPTRRIEDKRYKKLKKEMSRVIQKVKKGDIGWS